MNGSLGRFFNRIWTLKVNILSLFLSLIAVAFLCVISFTYAKDSKAILEFAKGIARRRASIVLAKSKTIAEDSERITEISAGFFPKIEPLTFENAALRAYLLNVVKYDPNFSNYYLGLPDGTFIGAYNQKLSRDTMFLTDPSKPLPADAAYALRYVDMTLQPPMDRWFYLNEEFKEVGHESLAAKDFNTVLRPWYVGAAKTRQLFWTGLYPFVPTMEKGISIGNPLYDANGDLEAVIGADVTFSLLSNFLSRQKIGKTGRVFILDRQGKVVAPDLLPSAEENSGINSELIAAAYLHYSQNPSQPDFVIKRHGVEYLAYLSSLPHVFGSDWILLSLAPLDDFLGQMIGTLHEVVAISLLILLLSGIVVVYFASRISSPIVQLSKEVDKISQLDLDSNTRVSSRIKEIILMDNSIAAMRLVIRSFARYVPKEIVKDLFLKKEEIALGGELKEITIFFSDIAGFTSIAESHPIETVIPLLAEYFHEMSKIILESHGTIDKFLGDGIMAFWGAPMDFSDHAARACNAALECKAMLIKLNQKRKDAHLPEFQTRFGINTGKAIVGNIGTEDRMNYTVIGDAVNITSRLQEVDKIYQTSIIISEDTYKQLGEEFIARPLDFVAVKGKKEKTKIYELIGKRGSGVSEEQIALCKAFTEAYGAMERNEWELAKILFTAIAQQFPQDYPTQIYLKRIEERHS